MENYKLNIHMHYFLIPKIIIFSRKSCSQICFRSHENMIFFLVTWKDFKSWNFEQQSFWSRKVIAQ